MILKLLIAIFLLTSGACTVGEYASSSEQAELSGFSESKQIFAQNVLGVQLAGSNDFENRVVFKSDEIIVASLFMAQARYVEPRRISAQLLKEEVLFEDQSLYFEAEDKRYTFEFRFENTPRSPGSYQIRFVEIARSEGKPVLLARLFFTVE